MEIIIPAVCTLLGVLITKVFDLISQRNALKNEAKTEIATVKDHLAVLEKDVLRTQLMVMIKDFPDEKTDILRLAQHYFEKLKGNWVMSDVFQKYLKENNMTIPKWFKMEGEQDD